MADITTSDPDAGWWPPGQGEPGISWTFEPASLRLTLETGNLDVGVETPAGPRELVSIPVEAIAEILALARLETER